MTTELILEWANVWYKQADHESSDSVFVPVFIETSREKRADIRVELSGRYT